MTNFSPAAMMQLSIKTSMMMAEANMVIWMRLWGMAGAWNTEPSENRRMVEEKQSAAIRSGTAMARAAMKGASPIDVAMAGVRPIAKTTGANVRRLSKRGPNLGK
jgi:hypothetical protein